MMRPAVRAAIVLVVVAIAAVAWRYAPDVTPGEDAGEFALLASFIGVVVALTAAGRVEDRLSDGH
jgi:hypothetical protein